MFFHNFTLQRNFLHIEPLQRQLFQTGMLHIAQYVQVAVKQHEPFLPVIHTHTIRTLHKESIRRFL